jgi:hypothetical protein
MSLVQIISRIGLFLLAILAIVITVMSLQASDWRGVFIGIGFFSVVLFLGDALRLEHIKRNRPEVSTRPSRNIVFFFFICCGLALLLSGINRLFQGNWLGGLVHLVFSSVLLVPIFTSWYSDYRRQI